MTDFDCSKEASEQDAANEAPLILVVEDDVDILSFIALELVEQYQVVKAVNGQNGLKKALELIPDLVITDLMMPVMGGVDFCHKLKNGADTSHIPVIMLTAKTSIESQLEGLQTGADDYVTKPFNIVLLKARVANLIESRRQLREQFRKQHPIITSDVVKNSPDDEFMTSVMSVVEARYSDGAFKSDELAAALNMGLRTLHRKLKAVTDRTPADFINEYRMGQAANLLETSIRTVTEIAFQVGCEDSSNFSRVFKKYYDVTPSEYRTARMTK